MARRLTYKRLSGKNSRFFTVYMVLLWCAVAAIAIGWFTLHRRLTEYENNQPDTVANAIAREFADGEYSRLTDVLDGKDAASSDAFRYWLGSAQGIASYDSVRRSGSGNTYTYLFTRGGMSAAQFTLERESEQDKWSVADVSIDESVRSTYIDHNAQTQLQLLMERVAAADYADLYALMTPVGFAEDTLTAFCAYMKSVTPDISAFTSTYREAGSERTYSILASGQLFATCTMACSDAYTWQIRSFELTQSIRTAYVLSLADARANEVLSLFREGKTDTIYACCTANGYPGGAADEFAEFLLPKLKGVSFTCSVYESAGEDERGYRIDGDGEKFADFKVRRSMNADGKVCWAVSDFSLPVWEPVTVYVSAPSLFRVYAGGRLLTQDDVVSVGDTSASDLPRALVEAHPGMADQVIYMAEGAFSAPRLTAADWNGKIAGVEQKNDTMYVCTPMPQDEELRPVYEEDIRTFCRRFADFSMGDLAWNLMLDQVVSGSEAATAMRNYDTLWIKKHNRNNNKFYDFASSGYIQYGDDMFSCDVTFKLSVVYTYGGKMEYSPSYRLYYQKVNGGWKLFAFVNTVE